MGGFISEVLPGSIAEEMELAAGDELLSINGNPIQDLIDYNYYSDGEELELLVRKPNGEEWLCDVEKDADEDLGLIFSANVFDGLRRCANHCVFCFVDQLQPNPRPSLKIKDDDYRMSFMEGNFITCTNLRDEDFQRIARLHLSPLYVSVHTVDPVLRQKMLGRKEPAEILLTLQRLISIGCRIHAQVVLVPGMNDGEKLWETIDALYAMVCPNEIAPGIATLAIVPVGLTKYQKNPELRLFTPAEAAAIIDEVEARQKQYQEETGNPFVYVSDEMYIKAGRPFPEVSVYGNLHQIENGVGMAALFNSQWEQVKPDIPLIPPEDKVAVVTGYNGTIVLRDVISRINRESGADIHLISVNNEFYGDSVTASGLVTGSCILKAVPAGTFDRILIPVNMLKFDEDVFLDDMTVDELSEALRTKVQVVMPDAASLLSAIFE